MVKTKLGMLVAEESHDEDYPSVSIYLIRPNGDKIMVCSTECNEIDEVLVSYIYGEDGNEEPTDRREHTLDIV